MTGTVEELLDATDKSRRLLQHGLILAGIGLLALASFVVEVPGLFALAIAMILFGLALFLVTARIKQRWQVDYKGHAIRFENNPFAGERLFIDNERVAKGGLGYRLELRGTIKTGDGVEDRIVAQSTAGLVTFRCRILAEHADLAAPVAESISDEQLLAEVRRRGLTSKRQ